jgi:hypothetical protein
MAFTPNPEAMLIAAKEKAQAASSAFDGPRYGSAAESLWSDAAPSPSGSAMAYGSSTPAVGNVVTSNLTLPQSNSEQESARYSQTISNAAKGMMNAGISSAIGNFSTLNGLANQNMDAIRSLDHQQAMNEIEIEKSKIGGGTSVSAVLGGIGSALGAASSFGAFGGGSSSSSFTPFSSSNPVTYSSDFQLGSPSLYNPWG